MNLQGNTEGLSFLSVKDSPAEKGCKAASDQLPTFSWSQESLRQFLPLLPGDPSSLGVTGQVTAFVSAVLDWVGIGPDLGVPKLNTDGIF